jgi:[acyl-carrier-protein] S-malonyltransferase
MTGHGIRPAVRRGAGASTAGGRYLAMFPGQGSQRPGMAAGLLATHPDTAGPVFALAEELLGLPLTELCTSGSAADLRPTEVAQPAVVATSLAVLAVLRSRGFEPAAVVGHSLGEYSALAAAGVMSPASALRLVRRRGELMARVNQRTPGAMVAVLGLPYQRVEELCALAADFGLVEVANYNEPHQIVVSGQQRAAVEVARLATEAGAERVVRLDVSAPFHCSLMSEIEEEFSAELDRHHLAEPAVATYSAVSADRVETAAEARDLLRRQLAGPVRWVETLQRATCDGYQRLVEVGPGRVLTGFARRIAPSLAVDSTGDPRRIEALLGPAGPPARRS